MIKRRAFVGGAALIAAGLRRPASAAIRAKDGDPRTSAEGQVRMRAALDGGPAFWPYQGTVYAIRPGERPLPILAMSGCQSEWVRRLDDGSYRTSGMLLNFFRDLDSGAFLDAWRNPFTGRTNTVAPNRFGGGSAIYPADGGPLRLEGPLAASESATKGIAGSTSPLNRIAWSVTVAHVTLRVDHAFDVPVQPQIEAQTLVADREAFFDAGATRVPATYAASTVIPWMRWMEMADAPGHLVWHTFGEKVFSIDELPADYRAKAGALLDPFTTRPAVLG